MLQIYIITVSGAVLQGMNGVAFTLLRLMEIQKIHRSKHDDRSGSSAEPAVDEPTPLEPIALSLLQAMFEKVE